MLRGTRRAGATNRMVATAVYLAGLLAPIDLPPFVHVVAGSLLTLYLPGRALLGALRLTTRDAVSRTVLAAGASLVLAILTGLVLDALPQVGLTDEAWRIALAILAILLGVTELATADGAGPVSARPPGGTIVWAILPLGLVASAMLLSIRSEAGAPEALFSELWAVETIDGRVIVGVRNHEGEPTRYRIDVPSASEAPDSGFRLHLDDGTTWTTSIAVPVSAGGEIVLYRGDDDRPYRRVDLPTLPSGARRDGVAGEP